MTMPRELQPFAGEILHAQSVVVPGAWPTDRPRFIGAAAPEAVAGILRRAIHQQALEGARIAWLFQEKMARRAAKMTLATGALGHLAAIDYVAVVSWTAWRAGSERAHLALVDHLLCHCGRTDKGWELVKPEIEEFTAIAARWGNWHLELRRFGQALRRGGDQLAMFDGDKQANG